MGEKIIPQANQNELLLWKDRKRTKFFGLPWTFTVYRLTEDRFRLFIKHSYDVKNLLSDLVEKERMSQRVTNREFMVDDECDFDSDAD